MLCLIVAPLMLMREILLSTSRFHLKV